ncbi:MAG: pyridoxamine 5'-phosphate oxidase family protein [Gammaproteobacteria bacterium]
MTDQAALTNPLPSSERTRLRRARQRGRYDRETIHAIVDATPMCHVGTVVDGSPVVMPTFHWREGDRVYWHGSRAGRAIKASLGAQTCLTISLLDGLVLARSAMHHSANYRSVMVFGTPEAVTDPEAKETHLRAFIEGLYPGRWDSLRPITAQELKATTVLSLPISEASAKVRTGGPIDDEADYDHPVWAGVVPLEPGQGMPVADARNLAGIEIPDHVSRFLIGSP